ncbi:MAG: LysR family transcriptional regulator [Cytophagales bacterium]
MTIQQLEYVLSLDIHRHFVKAAEACEVTQPTLSMQIQKLEEELGAKLFDRTRQPLVPTDVGEKVIAQAQVVVNEAQKLKKIAKDILSEPEGELRLGVIPTIPFAQNISFLACKISQSEMACH